MFNFWVKFCVPEPHSPCCHCGGFSSSFFIIVPVMSLCSQRWKTRRALMMHYHRSENEPHKSPWHLPSHNASKRTAAFLKDAAFPQSKTAQMYLWAFARIITFSSHCSLDSSDLVCFSSLCCVFSNED